jgi:uncharacterized membrane protein YfcA
LDILFSDYLLLGLAAILAGLVDAVVGGGGLIQVPALFSVFPQSAPATLFGTNKLASVWGTTFAARSYAMRIRLDWGIAIPAALAALVLLFISNFLFHWWTHLAFASCLRRSLQQTAFLVRSC